MSSFLLLSKSVASRQESASKTATSHIRETLAVSVKTTTQQIICYLKTEKEKRNNGQPTHKTAHLQAPTHKPKLQLAKEQFFCLRTHAHPPPLIKKNLICLEKECIFDKSVKVKYSR